ncbi:hypothetical protein [Streptomyces cucumeris]|uniref:hypothetical protein n=1 Tax=Streptomyces cucumeris TaxID=2962890 RepID=UPI003D744B83
MASLGHVAELSWRPITDACHAPSRGPELRPLGGAGVALVGAVVVFVLLGRPHHLAQDTGAEDPGAEAAGAVRSIPSAGRRTHR